MAAAGRIYQRGRIYYIAYGHAGHEFRESTRSADLEHAKRLLARRIAACGPEVAPTDRLSFDLLVRLYLEDYDVRQFRRKDTARRSVPQPDRPFLHAVRARAVDSRS